MQQGRHTISGLGPSSSPHSNNNNNGSNNRRFSIRSRVPTLEEAGDGFQEVGRRKRPPGMVAVQGEAVSDPRQGKLTFAVRDGTGLTGGQGGAANQGATAGLVATATPRATGEDVGMQGA